jgi:WS/DGAT/MGAT family acyltransferase
MSHLARAAGELTRAARSREDQLATPYQAPSSRLNRRISGKRAYAFETCELARIKRLAQLSGSTSNDVALAVCAGALRRMFTGLDEPPARPLTAAVPVSIRPRHGDNTGTALCFSLANLATEIPDVRERLAVIHASTRRAKEYLARLPRPALKPYAAVTMLPFLAGHLTRIGGRLRPMFNLVVSNVPGPKTPLYLEGAQLESAYPLSVLFHGQALNITCIRYLDKFTFGFTACPDSLPRLEFMPQYTREALAELENEFSFPHQQAAGTARQRKPRPARSTGTRRKQPVADRVPPAAAEPSSPGAVAGAQPG